jgi:hypothetical protein
VVAAQRRAAGGEDLAKAERSAAKWKKKAAQFESRARYLANAFAACDLWGRWPDSDDNESDEESLFQCLLSVDDREDFE